MKHLAVVVVAVIGDGRVVRALTQIAGALGRERDSAVVEAVKVDYVDRGVRHHVVTPQGGATHRGHGGQRG